MKIVAATRNEHKIKELKAIMEPLGFQVVSRREAGLLDLEIVEDGDTFEENSFKKAMEIHKICKLATIADDSGLMVDYLDGSPGILSSRFSGKEGDDQANNEKLLRLMEGVASEERNGKFISAITIIFTEEDIITVKGECKGQILYAPEGKNGFGYDPIFKPEGYEESFGKLPIDVKNKISHRARALEKLTAKLKSRDL